MPRTPPKSSGSNPEVEDSEQEGEEDPYSNITPSAIAYRMDQFQLEHDKFKKQMSKQLANIADLLKKVKSTPFNCWVRVYSIRINSISSSHCEAFL